MNEDGNGIPDARDAVPRFQRGDSNDNGSLDISDPVRTLAFLMLGTEPLPCLSAADANGDFALDISGAIFALRFLFLDGLPPPGPRPPDAPCGEGPESLAATVGLECASYERC